MFVKIFRCSVLEFICVWIPSFYCCSDVDITHELYLLCYVVYFLKFWSDGLYVTSKWSEFMNVGNFTIPSKVMWGVVQCTVDFSSIEFSGCFRYTTKFIFILITAKGGCSNHVVDNSVVTFIILIEPLCIYSISFQGYFKLINKKISNICWCFQNSILINSHIFAQIYFIIKCWQDEVDDSDWWLLGCGGEDPEH